MSKPNMDDYVDVAERIAIFRDKHPEGSLQSMIVEHSEKRVTVKAYAYRTPDDPRPGMGHASEQIPGATPFTRGSEVENAETSAWGRAIVAVLAADTKRGIASKQEVQRGGGSTPTKKAASSRSKQEPPPEPPAASPEKGVEEGPDAASPPPASDADLQNARAKFGNVAAFLKAAHEKGYADSITDLKTLTKAQVDELVGAL